VYGPDLQAWGEGDHTGMTAKALISTMASHIAGGSDEIQKNIIGERVLGLPKEPGSDKDVPFKDLKVGTQR
jgi:hypothetical protein